MSESQNFDVIVIGAGPGGYVCAIRAAQLGLKVACVEKRATLGGVCLNVGCIPSKAILQSSEMFATLAHDGAAHGIIASSLKFDVAKMMQRKDGIVSSLTRGIEGLFKKNKITWIKGSASFHSPQSLNVTDDKGKVTHFSAKHFVIATGSEPIALPFAPFDEKDIVSSTGALAFPEVPKRLLVVGGGVIGLELGSVWKRLGSEVTVVEFLDRILPTADQEVATAMQRILTKQGMVFHLKAKVTGVKRKGGEIVVSVDTPDGGKEMVCDKLLVSVGRRPITAGLNLEAIGVALGERGTVAVDERLATKVPGIWGIGDVVAGPMLAHKAEEDGVAVAENIAGKHGHVNWALMPSVIYTWPEVADLGLTEEDCKKQGIDYVVGKFPFAANGRAKALGMTDGFVKILADKKTDRVLGAHMIGPNVSELIGELVLAMEYGASSEDIARTVHAHPTLSEVVKEAALGADGRTLHM